MSKPPTYKMTISLSVLKHLGIGLYSNTPAVLSEAVANAWDADAANVTITIEPDGKRIIIEDDGSGMSIKDANEKFLYVGYDRRKKNGEQTSKGRIAMGRKGIGKLSLFSIANTVTVHSIKDGNSHAFKMNVKDIENSLKDNQPSVYSPIPVAPDTDLMNGTRIILTNLHKPQKYVNVLLKRLARRFTIIDDVAFNVTVNGKSISITNRGYQNKLQYVWILGKRGQIAMKKAKNVKQNTIKSFVTIGNSKVRIDGWIGTVEKPSQLIDDGDSLNKIVLIVRGKMAQENILDEYEEGGIYSKYLIGEIHADFLDQYTKKDIATTSRQKINENDIRYKKLKAKLKIILKIIQSKWSDFRNDEGEDYALSIPQINAWYKQLPVHHQPTAKRLFGKINQLKLDDDQFTKKQLLISVVLTFENLKLKNMLDKLDTLNIENLNEFKDVFLQLDDLEANAYFQTIKSRLRVIDKLKSIVDNSAMEKVIQKHLFDHLWLLDPTWEAIKTTSYMETTIRKEFIKITKNLSNEEKRGRLDIQYRTTANKHIIIELKKPDRIVDPEALQKQIKKYRSALFKILKRLELSHESIEIICVVGKPLSGWTTDSDEEKRSRDALKAYSARIVTYDQLINNAQKAYQDYSNSEKGIKRVYELITNISNVDKNQLDPAKDPSD